MENEFQFFYPNNFENKCNVFFEEYDFNRIVVCPDSKIRNLKLKQQRVCRFCGLKYGQVSFNSEAHIISKQIGNKYLVSDFECDNCNSIFSKYESQLSNFIGPIRAFNKLNENGEKKKFPSPDNNILTEKVDFYNVENCVSISRENYQDETFEIDRGNGTIKIKLIKQSYTPLLVYKAILKMALSCLNDTEIEDYKIAITYILSDKLDKYINGISKVMIYSLPVGTNYGSPIVFLYKKKNSGRKICTDIFMLCFMNQVYQIAIPLNIHDIKLFNNELIDVLYSPPFFADILTANSIQIIEQELNMSSKDLVKNEEEILILKYDKYDYDNAKYFDPQTNEIRDKGSIENETSKIIFAKSDQKITLPIKK